MDAVRASFERQWRARIDVNPGLSYYILKPDHLTSSAWMALVFGWIFSPEQGKEAAIGLFRRGFPLVLIDSPAGTPTPWRWSFAFLWAYFRRGAAIVKALQLAREAEGIGSVTLVTHADGSIAGACAAILLRELFGRLSPVKKIIMVEPAGVIHPDNPLAIFLRTNKKRRRDVAEHRKDPGAFSAWWPEPDPRRSTGYHWWGRHGENLFWTLFQALSMAWISLPKLLRPLNAAGTRIGVVGGTQSEVFSLGRMRRSLHSWRGLRGCTDQVLSVPDAGNWSFLIDPEKVVEAMLQVESRL